MENFLITRPLGLLSNLWVCLILCTLMPASAAPLFPNSVVSNDLEFITTDDPGVQGCIKYTGTKKQEMPDKRSDELWVRGVYTFSARYQDRTRVNVWVHPQVGSREQAYKVAMQTLGPVGKLPHFMRNKLDHIVIHKGNESAFAEADGRFFVLYTENMATRIANHDLEETVFHESIHATMDKKYSRNKSWLKAVQQDNDFITRYAASRPNKEDLAESALFAWTIINHPGRLPDHIEAKARKIMPNRLAFFEKLTFFKLQEQTRSNKPVKC